MGAGTVIAHQSTQSRVPTWLHARGMQTYVCREDSVQGAHAKAEKASGAGAHVGNSLPASTLQTECCLRNSRFLSFPQLEVGVHPSRAEGSLQAGGENLSGCTIDVVYDRGSSAISCSRKPCSSCLPC